MKQTILGTATVLVACSVVLVACSAAPAVQRPASAGGPATTASPTLPPAKQAIQARIDDRKAESALHPATKGTVGVVGPPEVEDLTPDGGTPLGAGTLFTGDEMSRPPNDKVDEFLTSWSVYGPSLNIDVWTGTRVSDRDQGFVTVIVWDADRASIVDGGSYDTPQHRGGLRISAADGTLLHLRYADGSRVDFDPQTRQFQKP